MHPDLPAVLAGPGPDGSRAFGLLTLVVVGLAMTAVMQSSTAAIAVTMSAYYAGAVGLDQGCALITDKHRNGDEFGHGGYRREQDRQAIGVRLHCLQADRCPDRLVLFPFVTPLRSRPSTSTA